MKEARRAVVACPGDERSVRPEKRYTGDSEQGRERPCGAGEHVLNDVFRRRDMDNLAVPSGPHEVSSAAHVVAQPGFPDLLDDRLVLLVLADPRELAASYEQLRRIVTFEEGVQGVSGLVPQRSVGDKYPGETIVTALSPTHPAAHDLAYTGRQLLQM